MADFCLSYECGREVRRGDARIFTLTTSGLRLRSAGIGKPQQVLEAARQLYRLSRHTAVQGLSNKLASP
jgi:hypothetical protein